MCFAPRLTPTGECAYKYTIWAAGTATQSWRLVCRTCFCRWPSAAAVALAGDCSRACALRPSSSRPSLSLRQPGVRPNFARTMKCYWFWGDSVAVDGQCDSCSILVCCWGCVVLQLLCSGGPSQSVYEILTNCLLQDIVPVRQYGVAFKGMSGKATVDWPSKATVEWPYRGKEMRLSVPSGAIQYYQAMWRWGGEW